ncbi:chemotaxis protein CheB [Teredinibacter turnerae]|uniref:chemotaxis protein CheB n=1 Tax=Teredinibacter turnerae TaxID=2426 RepID=UPI0003604C8D|nr:chemotaxis protein CheB [Teredinibacter turnerae]
MNSVPTPYLPTKPKLFIGVGASAGGLEALQTLLQHLPTDTGACFIVVQHLSPDFKSMMLELLSKHTSMRILNVKDGMEVDANCIYLIPPKKNMMVSHGRLRLSEKTPESGLSLPIDIFFRSLAEDQQHKAIGIILSGTGTDGSRGIKSLKEAGALVIAQEPQSAKFDGMPNSAINTGLVDLILRPEDIGDQLAAFIQHPLVSGDSSPLRSGSSENEDLMAEIFNVLKIKSEIDFAKYKPSTVARRIERRMTIKQVNSLRDYLTLIFKDPYEVQILSKELLIGVTRFFRDDDAFTFLREKTIPDIVAHSNERIPIRVWVAGCSTGEEAYSLAILFADEISKRSLKREVKVFATDVNADAITDASNGSYSEDVQHDVGANYLSTYFAKTQGNNFQIAKSIRQNVIFATHNMITDPPFSNMDLVSCRNILIYFQHSVQKRVLTSLHFSLKKDSYLFLGSSENLSDLAPHFETVNDRFRIYKKRTSVRIPISAAPPMVAGAKTAPHSLPSVSRLLRNYRGTNATGNALTSANELLITHYAPPCILINDEFEAVHVYGDVSPFIRRLPPGRISVEIKDLVNEDMSIAVSTALHRAKKCNEEVFYTDVYTGEHTKIAVNLRVFYQKDRDLETSPGYYWLIFEVDNADNNFSAAHPVTFDVSEQSRQRIEDLEIELKRSKEHLQVTVEELETTNEELQSANEELMSANEELQSTNEELQSVNEELYTVNAEYQEKISEISQINSDLDEVLGLSSIGIIFLDDHLLIRRYTQAATNYINLRETDLNRPLHHFSNNLQYENMLKDVSDVLNTGKSKQIDIVLEDKRVVQISIHPYRYANPGDIRGVAITFSDVSRARYAQRGLRLVYHQLKSSINNALDSLDNTPLPQPVKILILDDQPVGLALVDEIVSAISDFKCTTYQASAIIDAIEIVLKEKPHVCLVDYHLNGETAIDFIESMRANGVDIPSLVITADNDPELNAMLLSYGVLDLINKDDLSPQVISRSIRFSIRRREIDKEISKTIDSVNI